MSNNIVEPLLICKEDFNCIGQVAKHCDWEQLCIYIREQQNLSLLPKIGYCLYTVLMKWRDGWCVEGERDCSDPSDSVLDHLFNGGYYTACDGTEKMHFGLKRSLVHWAYGAYAYRHSFVDTPFGVVQKMNQDSVPVEGKVLATINQEQRTNAEYYWKMTEEFMCSVKDRLPCDTCDCSCGYCSGKKGQTLQRRGARFKNITKY